MSAARNKLPAERRQAMLRAVQSGSGRVDELAESFGVSEMTVRRDLRELAQAGKLERVRGGALNAGGEPPFEQTVVERFRAKDRIGAAAAALVADGETVMIDIGTTTLQAAHHLHGRRLRVVTSSLAVLEELLPDEGIELMLPGGVVRRNYRSLVGVLAEDALRQVRADVLFLGTSGVDEQLAVWDSTIVEVPIKRAMIEAADRVVLLADAEKFAMRGVMRVCGATAIDHVVTDAALPDPVCAAIEEAGIGVTRA